MHIAIDVTPLESAHKARGTGVYTRLLIEALQQYHKDNSYYFFTRIQNIPNNVDVIHFSYFDPFFLTLPIFRRKPTVVTVHDLIPIDFPSHFPRGIRGEAKWQIQKRTLRSVNRIITDSKASKISIMRHIKFPKKFIDLIYLAPDASFRQIKEYKLLKKVKSNYGLSETFFLYVGDINWNKNILRLLEGFNTFKKMIRNKTVSQKSQLVFVGEAFLKTHLPQMQVIQRTIIELHLSSSVRFLGFIPTIDLSVLYSMAAASMLPSIAEGFGFPILEAMQCGCPVVASNCSSLVEIAGPSILVNPLDKGDIARGMIEALNLQKSAWQKQAQIWVKNFSWQKVSGQTVESYKKALGEKVLI